MRSEISATNAFIIVVEVDLRRPDRGQPVVGPAQIVARHDVVHLGAAVEHHLEQRLQFVDAADTGQRGVLTDEWPQAIAPSTNAPCSRISATCAAATVAMATWVNCVRYSTPSGW